MTSNYYDVDAILAEEELVPSTTQFDFSYLSHLDPDSALGDRSSAENNSTGVNKTTKDNNFGHVLAEHTRIKMPLWAVEKWAMLGFVRVSLPRHYSRKARERLEADPAQVSLRKRNQHYFLAGRMLLGLMEESSKNVADKLAAGARRSRGRQHAAQMAALEATMREAAALRKTLLMVSVWSISRNIKISRCH